MQRSEKHESKKRNIIFVLILIGVIIGISINIVNISLIDSILKFDFSNRIENEYYTTKNIFNYNGGVNQEVASYLPDIDKVDNWIVGWSNSGEPRKEYTIKEIENGKLGDKIIFNSISDSVIGHEFNFVGARENNIKFDNKINYWNANEIKAEEGKTYVVRLYVHNNSPKEYDALAKDVSVKFNISDLKRVESNDLEKERFDYENGYYGVAVYGFINSSNSVYGEYIDGVKFVSDKPFKLQYIPGTATMENNGIGSKIGSCPLSDRIITENGVKIGYDKLDGKIPGCYQYAAYIGIKVMPIFL